MRVAILSSGGKDSTYAHWWAILQGWDVLSLITCKIVKDDSMMFQIPGTQIVKMQADLSDTNYLEFNLTGEEEIEMHELKNYVRGCMKEGGPLQGLDAIVTGALRSDYQKSRIERMCHELELVSFSPLWHNNSMTHMSGLISEGFELIMSSVSCDGLNDEWIGRTINEETLDELSKLADKYRFNIDGEGGEFETSVVNAPHFSSRIIVEGEKIWKNGRGFLEIETLKIEN